MSVMMVMVIVMVFVLAYFDDQFMTKRRPGLRGGHGVLRGSHPVSRRRVRQRYLGGHLPYLRFVHDHLGLHHLQPLFHPFPQVQDTSVPWRHRGEMIGSFCVPSEDYCCCSIAQLLVRDGN